ncbi:hypothetical protein CDN99_27850 [Roseateles aquatilis]|uniref:DUF4265 domain-containing protein n=1 Tax=Roseateles aquatilis TaxID=431061 RepID=A0A246IT97_9BURK|nr:DUF4265 domain-containing protein [Roseateles aquatilis]OWQ82897.1 hypothetical protein CDN99_27850 [Roseateles aquatilis]
MKYQVDDFEASHASPVWRDRASFIFAAHLGSKDGINEWEQLWGERIAVNRFILCCIPFFVTNLALGDEVEIDANSILQRVVRPSGQVTFRVWFGGQDDVGRQTQVREIGDLNISMEWYSENLLALSVAATDAQRLADHLQVRENEGLLNYETGSV